MKYSPCSSAFHCRQIRCTIRWAERPPGRLWLFTLTTYYKFLKHAFEGQQMSHFLPPPFLWKGDRNSGFTKKIFLSSLCLSSQMVTTVFTSRIILINHGLGRHLFIIGRSVIFPSPHWLWFLNLLIGAETDTWQKQPSHTTFIMKFNVILTHLHSRARKE